LRGELRRALERVRAVLARAEARAARTPWVGRALAVARRRPEAVLAAAVVTGVLVMVLHWK
jgi:hypothetical protein